MTPAVPELQRLLDQVHADPEADGPREVFADAVGGAWGELIIQQLRHRRSAGRLFDAENALWRAWQALDRAVVHEALGPLAEIATWVELERGFAERLTIWKRADVVRRMIGLPAWSLATGIVLHRPGHSSVPLGQQAIRDVSALLGHAVMQRVDWLGNLDPRMLARLLGKPVLARLTRLALLLRHATDDVPDQLATIATLRSLLLVTPGGDPPAWLPRLAVRHLEELAVRADRVNPWLAALLPLGASRITVVPYQEGSLSLSAGQLEVQVFLHGDGMLQLVQGLDHELWQQVASVRVVARHEHAERQCAALRGELAAIARRTGRGFELS